MQVTSTFSPSPQAALAAVKRTHEADVADLQTQVAEMAARAHAGEVRGDVRAAEVHSTLSREVSALVLVLVCIEYLCGAQQCLWSRCAGAPP